METNDIARLGLALALGLLVGLQRERSGPHVAGLRTIALVAILGAMLGLLDTGGGWLPVAGILGVAGLLIGGIAVRSSKDQFEGGLTTAVATLVVYAVGVAIARGYVTIGILVAGGVALLLHWKGPLHRFVDRIDDADARAIFRLVLIGLVILPLLPDEDYGPYGVLNPFVIWLIVVLICGISVISFLIFEILGPRVGTILGGVLGGLISSTATSVSYARLSARSPDSSSGSALVIMIASTVVFLRVAFEVGVVAPEMLAEVLPPLGVVAGVMIAISAAGYLLWGGRAPRLEPPEDRMDLKAALVFGVLYAAVLVGVAFARDVLGEGSLFAVAAVSGLTDVDAITLSTARMMAQGSLSVDTGWRMILIGFLANLVFKAAIVGMLGKGRACVLVVAMFAVSLAAGVVVLWLWPAAA